MIKFNELRITPDNEYLIIDVSIEDAEYFKDVVLDSIIIDTQDTYTAKGSSSNAVFTYTYTVEDEGHVPVYSLPDNCSCLPVQDEESKSYCFTNDYTKKSIRLVLNSEDLGIPISENMFFVHVVASGEPTLDTPYELRNSRITGVAINTYVLYKHSMHYVKELGDSCNIPKNFIDYVLKVKALDLAIKTGNYQEVAKYWNKFFKLLSYNTKTYSNCKCYGNDI